MNETVTLPQLITRLAAEAGCTPAQARKYLHDLFAGIEQSLAEGKNITVAGIGEFAPGIDSAHPVLFRPDTALAAALNEPFEAFSAVELPADMPGNLSETDESADGTQQTGANDVEATETESPVTEMDEEPAAAPAAEAVESLPEAVPESQPEPETESGIEPGSEPETEETKSGSEPETEPGTKPEPQPAATVGPAAIVFSSEDSSEDSGGNDSDGMDSAPVRPAHSPGMWLTCGIMIGLILGLVGGYFAGEAVGRYHIPADEEEEYEEYYDDTDSAISIVGETPAPVSADTAAGPAVVAAATESAVSANTSEAIAPVAAQPKETAPAPRPVKEPIYDTITSTQFLTTLARKHYGVKNYWIFIYEANPGLGNPNNIRPGTRVTIPERSSFEEATPEATKAKAQQRLNALARKYRL